MVAPKTPYPLELDPARPAPDTLSDTPFTPSACPAVARFVPCKATELPAPGVTVTPVVFDVVSTTFRPTYGPVVDAAAGLALSKLWATAADATAPATLNSPRRLDTSSIITTGADASRFADTSAATPAASQVGVSTCASRSSSAAIRRSARSSICMARPRSLACSFLLIGYLPLVRQMPLDAVRPGPASRRPEGSPAAVGCHPRSQPVRLVGGATVLGSPPGPRDVASSRHQYRSRHRQTLSPLRGNIEPGVPGKPEGSGKRPPAAAERGHIALPHGNSVSTLRVNLVP